MMKKIILLALIAFLTASCASQTGFKKELSDEDALAERANLLWEARKNNDWQAVGEIVDPDIREGIASYLDSFKKQPNMSEITSFSIESLHIENGGTTAGVVVKTSVKVTYPLLESPVVLEQTLTDRWVKRKGIWYVIVVKPDIGKVLEEYAEKNKKGIKKGIDK